MKIRARLATHEEMYDKKTLKIRGQNTMHRDVGVYVLEVMSDSAYGPATWEVVEIEE